METSQTRPVKNRLSDRALLRRTCLRFGRPPSWLRAERWGAEQEHKRLECCEGLTLGLVVAGPTPTLGQELAFVHARLEPSQGGYAPITGLIFPAFGIFLDEVSETERDGLLALFGHGG
ncbi:MAG: hypothetical protein MUF54_07645, partial [Polyangiaceae bacterium]|nr:hypothetical protein [Polyangiaceae bacterium]